VPSHSGIPGNDRADTLAMKVKEQTENSSSHLHGQDSSMLAWHVKDQTALLNKD